MDHPLLAVFTRAAAGEFPPVDGDVTFLPELDDGNRAIVAFTGHAVVASPLTADAFVDLGIDGFGAALAPRAVLRVAGDGVVGVNDVVLAAAGTGGGIARPATTMWDDHPRVEHARHLRTNVVVHGDERGFVTIADGLAGRRELSVEVVAPGARPGLGRELIRDALGAAEPSGHLFAAVSPGNARSLRSFLAAGFTPIGSEILIDCSPPD